MDQVETLVQQEGIRNAVVLHVDYVHYREERSICGFFRAALRIPSLSLCHYGLRANPGGHQ